jgi:hypothetical protein
VHDIARVVAEREQHASAAVECPDAAVRLLGGRTGEYVADDGRVTQPRADEAGEGRVVAGPTTDDDRDMPLDRGCHGHHRGGARNLAQVPPVRADQPLEELVLEASLRVVDIVTDRLHT